MNSPDDNAARLTLKLAGVFQEVRDIWVRRLENYFGQLESLIEGQWIEPKDMEGIVREAASASREALDGLGSDLSAELVHESRGVFGRFESERQSLLEEITDLRMSLAEASSGEEGLIRRENSILRHAIMAIPEYKILEHIRVLGRGSYKEIAKSSGESVGTVRKMAKKLMKRGHINIDKKTRPHSIIFLSAPWRGDVTTSDSDVESSQMQLHQLAH
jgi:hypothetical protein